jgi:two-component system LytT family sensor kinase
MLWSVLLTLPIPFLIPGSPLIIFPFAWLFQLLIIIPVSWLLYRQQKDHILAFRGLEKDHSKSKEDIQFLRSHINPHFLFNTLNTIYASALDENANRTAKCLQMLGHMMRFMLAVTP